MAVIELAEFAPDRSDFDPTATDTLVNLTPRKSGWGPFPSFVAFSEALPARPQGAFLANLGGGIFDLFVGTGTNLYRLSSGTLGWEDVSRTVGGAYATPADRKWSFAQYGALVLATNGVDPLQSYNTASPTQFAELSADAPAARNVSVVGDFVFLTATTDGPNDARWSGLNQPTFWTAGQQASDSQIFGDGGEVMAIAGFERGSVIFQEDCIREAALAVDTPLIMAFKKTVENHGVLARDSVVNTGAGIFYLSQDGFYRYGTPPTAIGAERVDKFFFGDVDLSEVTSVSGSEDPYNKVVYWSYRSTACPTEYAFDKILAYHYALDRWTMVAPGTMLSGLIEAVTPGYTLDTLDGLGYTLDSLPFSLDSRALASGAPSLAAFDRHRKLGFFNGPPLAASGQTCKLQLTDGRRTFVSGFRPITDAEGVKGRVARFERASGPAAWGSEHAINRTGLVPARSDGRFHRLELSIPAEAEWTFLHGAEPMAAPSGLQ
jgi:hypothetical protein